MNLEEYFISNDFYNSLKTASPYITEDHHRNLEILNSVISACICYSLIISNDELRTDGIDTFLNKLLADIPNDPFVSMDIIDKANLLLEETVLNKLNIPKELEENKETLDKCGEYLAERLFYPVYIFHAFNSAFYESIKEHGLNPVYSNPNQYEIDQINSIFESHSLPRVFGWQKLNCEGKVSYSNNSSVAYSYGCASPEWFSEFCGGSIEFFPPEKYDKMAFYHNDYNSALNNLTQLMNENGFNYIEKKQVLDFFNKNWVELTNNDSYLFIKKDYSELNRRKEIFNDLKNNSVFPIESINEYIKTFTSWGESDRHTNKPISSDGALFIKMPNYGSLYKHLTNSKINKR